MDSNRSEDQEEASYSDDFEHDAESQDSPFSDDKVEIKVFKSAVGSLTIQPKKVNKNAPMLSDNSNGHEKSARTLSELSLMAMKNRPPATASGNFGKSGNKPNNPTRCVSLKMNQRSKTSLTTLGNQAMSLHRQPLAQEKLDPQDIPASVAASVSSVSISRLSLRNRSATGYGRGTNSNIRRVVAHTSIKEKSYASAKYKTYHTPPMFRPSHPPLKAGVAKPHSNVAQRVASAKRMTIMDLKSKIKLLQDEIEKLKKENRFLNHLHHRQDNALRKWEGKDAELPRLLNQHKDEIRALQEQLRRAQQNAREHNEKLAVRDKKILKLENELDKLKALVHEEHLQDRHTLQQDLDITRMNLAGAEKRIREYMRHVEILEKNHKHQLAAQERKFIKANTHTYELQQVVANLKLALRNKDRMLNYIQMRSSGRTLIRAFHAERADRGDDMLYGSSIQADLNGPYQPLPLPPLMKSHSFEFGSSRGTSPRLDDMRDYEFFSRRFTDNHRKIRNYQKDRHNQEENGDSKKSSRPISRLSQSLEFVVGGQPPSPKNKSVKGHSRTLGKPTIKAHGSKNSESNAKSVSKLRTKHASQEKSHSSLANKDQGRIKNSNNALEKKNEKSLHREQKTGKQDKLSPNKSKSQEKAKVGNGSGNHAVNTVESKELIYKGSTKGFKYEGPFVNCSSTDIKKDSTEFLYSPKSDKLSEHSLSSTCTSHTVSSSRSEIISNIDILSARIRESCVNVPPPEEALNNKSPGINFQNKSDSLTENKPAMGPAGDTPASSSRSNPPYILSNQPISNETPPQLLQPMPLVAQTQLQEINSPRSHQSFASPRIQLHSMSLPSVNQSAQFQLVQPSYATTNYVAPISDQSANNPNPSPTQLMENGGIQYLSPRVSHNFTPVQAVNLSEPQQAISLQEQNQSSSRVSPDFSYFSFATNSAVQEGMSPNTSNVTVFQTNSPYANSYASPRVSNLTHGPFHNQQAVLLSPSARSTYPRVGYINSGHANNNSEQSLPSIASNVSNKPSYNPSYYVNLGSWK